MAFNWKPRNQKIYLPKQGSISDAINSSYSATFGSNKGIIGSPEFEAPTTTAFVQGGRAGVQGGDFVSDILIPAAARSIEAPLRPLNQLTGGRLGEAINWIFGEAQKQPGPIGTVLRGAPAAVGVLDASNRASRAMWNVEDARLLAQTAGLSPDTPLPSGLGRGATLAEWHAKILNKWGLNEITGEEETIESLTARAIDNPFNFGEYKVDENGIVGFFKEGITDPLNLTGFAGITGRFGARAATRLGLNVAAEAVPAGWARATISAVPRSRLLPRIGAGAQQRLRGTVAPPVSFSRGTQWLDNFGNLGVGPARLGNVVDLARKIYFPKYGTMVAPRASQLTAAELQAGVRTGLGLNRATAALASWQLGGATQMLAGTAAEGAMGLITGRTYDEETGVVSRESAGWADDLQDIFHAINNNHPLSDNQNFVILSLFSPWGSALSARAHRNPVTGARYYADGATQLMRKMSDLTGEKFVSADDFFSRLGDGDAARGRRKFEILANKVDMALVQNQFSDFTNAAAQTIEGNVQRARFLQNEVIDTVIRRRASRALGPRSLADNILRFYREGAGNPETRLARGTRTITWEGFVRNTDTLLNAEEHMLNQGLLEMGALQVADNAPILRETVEGLISRLNKLPDDARVPREIASFIIEDNPALIYMDEFWREFSITLGQMLEATGRTGKKELLPTEGITVGQLKAKLNEVIDSVPADRELYHESFINIEHPRITPDESPTVLHRPIPQDAPRALARMHERVVSRGNRLLTLRDKVIKIRNNEFFRSGKSKFETASELTGHFGNIFRRRILPDGKLSVDTFDKQAPPVTLKPIIRFPKPGEVTGPKIEFAGGKLVPVQKAFQSNIGEHPVYIFQPEAQDKWFVARRDGGGDLMIDAPFNTAQEAGEWVHSISSEHVSVKIDEDGVIEIEGRILPPIREEIMDPNNTASFNENEEVILEATRGTWERNNDRAEPFSVVGFTSSGFGPMGGDTTYYFIGEDGLPHGSLRIPLDTRGNPQSPSLFVDKEYRGQQSWGRAMDKMYDEAFLDGIDLSKVSGVTNTPAGARATDRYWGARRDTIDTEALELSIKHGGRIIEVDVVPESIGDIAVNFETLRRGEIDYDMGLNKFDVDPDDIRGNQYEVYGTDAMLYTDYDTGASILVTMNEGVLTRTKVANASEASRIIAGQPVINIPEGGNKHSATLARWGFEEVARYADKAVYAYRGGNTESAILNSRIDGANLPYRPTARVTKTRAGALNIARRRVNQASLEYPTLETLGPGYTNGAKAFNPKARRQHLTELAADLQKQSVRYAEDARQVEDALETVAGLKKVTDINHWWNKAAPEEITQLVDMVKELNANWPSLQIADGNIYADPRNERFGHLVTGYGGLARHVFDYGFLSPISRFYDAALSPRHARSIQKDVYAELLVHTALVGMSPEQTERFLQGVRQRVAESRSARGIGNLVGLHKARNIRALDESTLRVLIEETAGEAVLNKIFDRYGSVQKMVTEAANGLMNKTVRRARHGGKISKLEANANAAFRHYQYDPVLEHVSDTTHSISKYWYPLLRFTADPMFMMMNLIEPYMYGISRQGISAMGMKTPVQKELNRRAVERSSRHSIPAGGFADTENLPIETLMTDAGVFSIPRNMRDPIEAEHQQARMESYKRVHADIPASDPLAQIFQERFGAMNGNEWAAQMDEVMYGWLNNGPEETVLNAFREMKELYKWTDEDMAMLAPWMNRFAEMHRAAYDDIADLYIGRLNRTGIERVLDNFWLLWPLSYTIKATKWVASIMFNRIGGVNTGATGAYLYTEYRERFMRALENDQDMQEWMEENRDFIFLFEMMLPMSPESIGVSLNVPVRIATSWLNSMTIESEELTNAIGDYSYIETVPESVERGIRVGPFRTWALFKRLMGQMGVPGFTYDEGGNWMDNYTPSR